MAKSDENIGCIGTIVIIVILLPFAEIIRKILCGAAVVILVGTLIWIICKYLSNPIDKLYNKADKLCKNGQYMEGIEIYKKAHSLESLPNPYFFYAVGLAYYEAGDYKQAKQYLKNAISKDDKYYLCHNPEFYYALARTYLRLNKYKIGLTYIDKLLDKLDKNSINYEECKKFKAEYLFRQSVIDKDAYRYPEAIQNLEEAIDLIPDNLDFNNQSETLQKFENMYEELQKLYKEEELKIEDLYNQAVALKENKQYNQALEIINNCIALAKKQNISDNKFDTLKESICVIINNIKLAEEKYDIAIKKSNEKRFNDAIQNLEEAVKLNANSEKYKDTLEIFKQKRVNVQKKAEEFYLESENHFKNKDFDKALSSINSAIDLIEDSRYSSLKADIEREYANIIAEKEAEELYIKAKTLYDKTKTSNPNYNDIVNLLENANKKCLKNEYQNFLQKVKSERDTLWAEDFYENAKSDFKNKRYESALSSINEAIKLLPNNSMYIDLKQKINWEKHEYDTEQEANQSHKDGLRAYNNGDFVGAINSLTQACNIKPDNEEWQGLLEKVKTRKIDIMFCSKKGLLTLDFIDEQKANDIIKARNDGKIWYGYEEFAQEFNFQPHEQLDIEAKIAFPLKQGAKLGRTIDF